MISVLLRGPVLSMSGYGVHTRQFFKWLNEREDVEVTCQPLGWGNTPWVLDTNIDDSIENIIESCKNFDPNKKYDVSVQVQLPDEWDPKIANKNIGVSAFVETNSINPEWIKHCKSMDSVVVPSSHTKESIKRTKGGEFLDINVVSETYDETIFHKDDSLYDLNGFNFLIVSQLTSQAPECDRKNLFNTVKWFCEVFNNDKNVGLVIKTNLGRATFLDREVTKNRLKDLISTVKKGKYPKIHLLHGNLTTKEMGALYNHDNVKALVNLTRGEGFGLPILESAVCGLPVISTGWSGHVDILGKKSNYVDYTLVKIPQQRVDGRIFLDGMIWAEPIENNFKRKVRQFKRKPATETSAAEKYAPVISKKMSQEAFNKKMDAILQELL